MPAIRQPDLVPSVAMLSLIGTCVSRLTDVVLITEAEPLDPPGPRIVFVNDAFEGQTGYSREEVLGKTPRILQGPLTDTSELRRIGAAFRRWENVRTELVNYTKGGQAFHVEMDIVPIADASGWYTHWVSIQRDATERKRAEGEAVTRELQRTQSIGTLAIGIAHDFNNIIAAILGNVVLGRQDIQDGRNASLALEQIDHAASRARNLVQQILAYGRRQPQSFVRQPLAPLVRASVELLRATLPSGVSLNAVLESRSLDVFADAGQLNQVLLNLGTNAWHAMRGSCGRIDVRLTVVPSTTGKAVEDITHAVLEIEDNGSGMDATTLAHLFEPYFTTKPIGQGTGLGLSVVWGIVKAHGATISVESQVGRGSNFRLTFPVLAGESKAHQTPISAAQLPLAALPMGAGRSVLIVDDDEVVLLMLEGILKRASFRVRSFTDPLAALEAVRSNPSDVDIVITDLNMPSMSGLQLARKLALIKSGMPVVLGSGYVSDELASDAMKAGIATVFRKEVAVEQLPALLCDVLDNPGASGYPSARVSD